MVAIALVALSFTGVLGVPASSGGASGTAAARPPVVGMASTPDGGGYWLVASDGGVFAYGDAAFYGSAGGFTLNAPVVGMAPTPDGGGYWLVASDGGVFAYGDALFYGSAGGIHLNRPIVGMAGADGGGYWLVASDGGVFSYGAARFYGSTGSISLRAPVVGMASAPGGGGYWLVASDGGVFSYGDAGFFGSAGALRLNAPVVGMASAPDGGGYWLAGSDGGVLTYGDAGFYGSPGDSPPVPGAAGVAGTPSGAGYWLVTSDGSILTYGDARFSGSPHRTFALYGDSLGMEAAPFLTYMAATTGASVLLRAYNGWAICDDLDAMASDAASRHPSVALVEFSGNALTPCMAGFTMGTTDYYDKYQSDAQQAIDILGAAGIPVVLIGPPTNAWANLSANVVFLNQIYASLAAANTRVTYDDAGQSVLDDGRFTLTLPCLPIEPCDGPGGTNVVRSPDGVHFCPTGDWTITGWYDVCNVYSSGAFRFALAMLVASSGQ